MYSYNLMTMILEVKNIEILYKYIKPILLPYYSSPFFHAKF